MASDRIQRQIDRLLGDPEKAVTRFDLNRGDALKFLEAAIRGRGTDNVERTRTSPKLMPWAGLAPRIDGYVPGNETLSHTPNSTYPANSHEPPMSSNLCMPSGGRDQPHTGGRVAATATLGHRSSS